MSANPCNAMPVTSICWHRRLSHVACRPCSRSGLSRYGSDVNVYPPPPRFSSRLGFPGMRATARESSPVPDLVVIGNSISRGNPEVERILDEKIPYCSMPQLIENYFLPGRTSLVVAGTHGKTTLPPCWPGYFKSPAVAGFSGRRRPAELQRRSYGLAAGKSSLSKATSTIRPSSIKLRNFCTIIRRADSHVARIRSCRYLSRSRFNRAAIPPSRQSRSSPWTILIWGESRELREVTGMAFCPVETFGLTPDCDWCAGDILWHDDATEFRVAYRGKEVTRIRIPVAGRTMCSTRSLQSHSRMAGELNAAPSRGRCPHSRAFAAAWRSRRSERRLVVEDFAHHPTAIRLTLEASRTRWPAAKSGPPLSRAPHMRRKYSGLVARGVGACRRGAFGTVSRAQLLAEEDRFPGGNRSRCPGARSYAEALGSAGEIAGIWRECSSGGYRAGDVQRSFDGLIAKLLEKLSPRWRCRMIAGVRL